MIDKSSIEAIKQSIDLRTIVSPRLTNPKNQSDGRIKATCPFPQHNDSTPSFYVGPQGYICFGCGRRGDIFNWYEEFDKKDFIDTAVELGKQAGIAIGFENEEELIKWREQTNNLAKRIDVYMNELWEHDDKVDYLHQRKFTDDTIVRFGLGYDKKRNAITIPFYDSSMRPINIIYRSLDPNNPNKYIYDSDAKPFKGSLYWFNESTLHNAGTIYIVEGPLDAITLEQLGRHAVAYHGSKISDQQIQKLRRFLPQKIVYCPDTKTDNDLVLGSKAAKYLKKSFNIPVKVILPHGDINDTPESFITDVLNNELSPEIAFLPLILVGDEEEQRLKAKQYIADIDDVLARDDVISAIAANWRKPKELVSNYLNISDTSVRIISVPEAIDLLEEQVKRIGLGSFIKHPDFHEFLDNVGAGHNMCLTARTNVGKTNMALNIAGCVENPAHVMYFSLEQPASEIMARMISIKSDIYGGLDGTPITTKAVKQLIRNEDVSWKYIRGLTEELCPNFHLYDKPCDIKQIENVTRMAIDNYGPNMIVMVDYLGLIRTKGITDEYAKYSNIALDLQSMAKDLNIFLLFVHQLSRRAGAGEVAVTIDMLRGSGIIEEVSDIVLALWYKLEKDDELHQIQRLPAKPIEVAVLKNRHGPTSSYDYTLDTRNLVYRRSNDDMITGWGDLH